MFEKEYKDIIYSLKTAILKSRYKVAVIANKEMLSLYFTIGREITEKVKLERWGAKVLDSISNDLQNELPGLKGFSATNLKRMRLFYTEWQTFFEISPKVSDQIELNANLLISPTVSDQFTHDFSLVSFSHHYELLVATKSIEERRFYITMTAREFWSLKALRHHLKSKLFVHQSKLPNNFSNTISNNDLRGKALQSFKDEYLLDYINIEDPDEEDERLIENEIVRNIKRFLMSLGADFAFIGNQYRFKVNDDEYFIDLLFFNRKLQSLVVFDLKKGKFKPEYMGKMNFYLSVLDDCMKQSHENPSIGIILCREKNNKTVEFSFRDFNKAMGVATYRTASELPDAYKDILPDAEMLKKLME